MKYRKISIWANKSYPVIIFCPRVLKWKEWHLSAWRILPFYIWRSYLTCVIAAVRQFFLFSEFSGSPGETLTVIDGAALLCWLRFFKHWQVKISRWRAQTNSRNKLPRHDTAHSFIFGLATKLAMPARMSHIEPKQLEPTVSARTVDLCDY